MLVSLCIFSSALWVGMYEFAGVFAASVEAWAADATLPLGSHLWLSTAGWPLLVGGSLFILWVVSRLGQQVLGEAPGWLTIVLGVLGVIAAVSGVERFLQAIAVPCPECDGKAFQTSGKPIVYECRECRHVARR